MVLSILFFITALCYASVGFGGGSSYIALLVLWDVPYALIPVLALICNIVVVSGNSVNFIRSRQVNTGLLIPHLIGSVPAAYIGGLLQIDKGVFEWLIFVALALAGIQMLWNSTRGSLNLEELELPSRLVAVGAGVVLGFLSGIIGIGGGIFLAPLLYLLKAGSAKHIASTCSLFILINSAAGLIGQIQKATEIAIPLEFLILPVIVLIGGQIGNHLSLRVLTPKKMSIITALLVLFVAIRLGMRVLVVL